MERFELNAMTLVQFVERPARQNLMALLKIRQGFTGGAVVVEESVVEIAEKNCHRRTVIIVATRSQNRCRIPSTSLPRCARK